MKSLVLSFIVVAVSVVVVLLPELSEGCTGKSTKCREDADCGKYSYCFHSYWSGRNCATNYEKSQISCSKMAKDGSGKYPDHEVCMRKEKEDRYLNRVEDSMMRCFPDLDYTCARASYGPCTPNYGQDGNVIPGQEESCPENFECVTRQKEGGFLRKDYTVRVCVALEPPLRNGSMFINDFCDRSFDCSYSELEGQWSRCDEDGMCIRAVE